ncbi:hypothetical protein [Paenibacillus sp. LK1]|uniref:hypothetical protein n=1 Tax=Paenibacillus sp. LK1 TaxID=2053014 RepID=UPI000C1853CB|nr:hypothetical protein [Paenibacillus sp. LK1]PIH59160.1 hypothetical protein CS562_14590 [Paenibacillus sp. LK1]
MQIVNLGTMAGTNVDAYVKNVKNSVDMPNGSFVVITGQVAGQPDLYVAATPTDVTKEDVLLVRSPELIEVNGLRIDLTDVTLFTNSANRPATAFHLKVGDDFTITDDGITGVTAKGKYVVPVNGALKPAAADDLTGNTLVAMQVVDKTTISVGSRRIPATKLLVVRSV